MRLHWPSAAMAARKSYARAFHANSCLHGVRARAFYEPPWRNTVDSSASWFSVVKRYAKMQSNLPSAAAAARKPHTCTLHARA
eukprot:9594038-Lingulodinium_polyedra.AAC.1